MTWRTCARRMGFPAGVIIGTLVTAVVIAPIVGVGEATRGSDPDLARVLARLDAIEGRLATPVVPTQRIRPRGTSEICIKRALGIEAGGEVGAKVNGAGEGRLGAEAFGNGVLARLVGQAETDVKMALKGGQAVEFSRCFDTSIIPAGGDGERGSPVIFAALDDADARVVARLIDPARHGKPGAGDDEALVATLASVAQATGLMNDPTPTLTLLLSGADDLSLFGLLREGPTQLRSLIAEMPLPPRLRARLDDPGSLLDDLRQLREAGLCGNPDIPTAFQDLLADACPFKDGNRFIEAFDRIDTVTQDVLYRVQDVRVRAQDLQTKVGDIIDRLPNAGSSIFK